MCGLICAQSSTQPTLGAADEPWFRRSPTLGTAVALGGPVVLGFAILAMMNVYQKRRRG